MSENRLKEIQDGKLPIPEDVLVFSTMIDVNIDTDAFEVGARNTVEEWRTERQRRRYELGLDLPIIPLPGSTGWREAYTFGKQLDMQFPGQDAGDLTSAAENNGWPQGIEGGEVIKELVCWQSGCRDEEEWVWKVRFEGKGTYIAFGGCDYTGWDCQSNLEWHQLSYR